MKLSMAHPAPYKIQVHGIVDPSWSSQLGAMEISVDVQEAGSVTTSLTGDLVDQAALLGVLNNLYNHHFPLLSVQCLLDLDRDNSDQCGS